MKKLLIIGSSGMVGHMVTEYMSKQGHDVYDISRKKARENKTYNYDLREYKKIFALITQEKFDYVINCAAVLVKQSDENRENAVFCNAYFPQLLANYCSSLRTKVVQLSSGGVFSGRDSEGFGNDVYYEKSLISPPTFYGATKAAGEIVNKKDITIRSDFWGPDTNPKGGGLFNWLINQNGSVNGYDDIHFNGISNLELCHFIEWYFENNLIGIVQVGAKYHISKGDLLRLIKDVFNLDVNIQSLTKMARSVVLKNTFKMGYTEKTYLEMCEDLKKWIEQENPIHK